MWLDSEPQGQTPPPSSPPTPGLGLETQATVLSFHTGAGDSNPDPLACTANTLLTDPSYSS